MSWPVELSIALRYLRPRRTFVSVITVLSVLGVTIGVAVLIIVIAVMEGFEQRLSEKVIGFNAHLVVSSSDLLRNAEQVTEIIHSPKHPEVLAASPYVMGPVLVEFAGRITAPVIKGVPANREDAVIPLHKYIISGEYELRGLTVLVGEEWAKRNMALPGDKLLIYAPGHLAVLREAQRSHQKVAVLPSEYLITGVFRTGLFDYDLNFFITSLENAQQLYNLGDGVHGINVRVKDPLTVFTLAKQLRTELKPPLMARTWMDLNKPLFTAIATERSMMTFILFFIVIVAAFGLCSTLITITVQKSREIGALKALGARGSQIRLIFSWYGFIVGILGSALGVACGLVALHYRNPFRYFLDRTFGITVFPADVYNFAELPAVVHPETVAGIALAAVILCVLAALIPAQTAAKLAPARALRYE